MNGTVFFLNPSTPVTGGALFPVASVAGAFVGSRGSGGI